MWYRIMGDSCWDSLHKYQRRQEETQQDHVIRRDWFRVLPVYLPGLILWGLFFLAMIEQPQLIPFSILGILLLIPVVVTALFWGVGPTMTLVLLSMIMLDYLYVPFISRPGVNVWSIFTELCSFAMIGIGIAILASQCQRARQRALQAKKEAQMLRTVVDHMDNNITMLCHELKTPLAMTNAALQLAQHHLQYLIFEDSMSISTHNYVNTVNNIQGLLTQIEEEIRIQNRMVNDLHATSQSRVTGPLLNMKACNLLSIVQDAVHEQRQMSPTRTFQLRLPAQTQLALVADADRLKQAISNYLTNAHKYSPLEQPITITVRKEGENARVSVRDKGPGIATNELAAIWERFYQSPTIKLQNGTCKGLGLGLHICRSIIECHDGQVGAHNNEGQGVDFWFTIPLPDLSNHL